jgi:MtrB/PioB family decaheme-associated outer membrane protein
MKVRAGLLLTGAASGALLMLSAGMASRALAEEGAYDTGAWWYRGYIEAGWRGFLNNPQRDGIKYAGQDSLAKYYEYSTVKPGAFMDGRYAAGSKDGLYKVDLWAKNVGYTDQSYSLDLAKVGEHELSVGFDQTPHVYSSSAQTIYSGVGTNSLTLPAGLANRLATDCNNANPCANPNAVRQDINTSLYRTDIGIRRDTASVDYRYTPNTDWDFRANYSNMHRTGTQVEGVVFSPGTSGVASQVPKPVDDTTQNFGVSGEYAGTSPWGKKFNFKVAYNGSVYQDRYDSYSVENPFCLNGQTACARTGQLSGRAALMSLWPDNQANGVTATLGADLLGKSRYMGTVSYTMMRQNQNFIPFTSNPNLGAAPGGQPWNSTAALPFASLDGAINTLLVNNVLTTQITPDLKSKLSYRYYDYDNNTPERRLADFIVTDANGANATNPLYAPVSSLSPAYTKQNGGAELTWRASPKLTVGTAYGYERYNWMRADVDVTNEHSGKAFADWTIVNGVLLRASWLYAQRKYETYDYVGNVASWQWPDVAGTYNPQIGGTTRYASAYRQFLLDNRERNKGKFEVMIDLAPGVTLTPSFIIQNDNYQIDNRTQEGVTYDHSWSAGAELSWLMNHDTTFLFSVMREHHDKFITQGPVFPVNATQTAWTQITDDVDTLMVGANYAVIPNKLDVKLSYTVSTAVDHQPINLVGGAAPSNASGGQFPDVTTLFQRFEALAKYKFDDSIAHQFGWKGDVYAKLRYAWERNSVANWQNDIMQNYMTGVNGSYGYMTWLAYDNPNYNTHLLGASISWTW